MLSEARDLDPLHWALRVDGDTEQCVCGEVVMGPTPAMSLGQSYLLKWVTGVSFL